MKLVFSAKRHCSSLPSLNLNSQTQQFKILQYCKSGALFDAIHLLNSADSTKLTNKPFLFASLLQTCIKVSSFNHGLQIHAHLIKSGLDTDRFVGNILLSLYFKLGSNFFETRRVFDGLYHRDAITWTSMITGYTKEGKPKNALELFCEMMGFGIEPNGFALSAVIKACAEIGDLRLGRCFHGVVMALGFTRNDLYDEALRFFYLMQREIQSVPDMFTFGTVLTACGNLRRVKQGKEVHAIVITSGCNNGNMIVESSLVDMYAKCGLLDHSQRVFDRMRRRNSVSWTALMGGYCQNGDFESVINIFREAEMADLYSFGTVLRACAGLAAIRQGKEVHCQYVRRGGWRDVIAESALVDLYAKCGCIDFAHRIFTNMPVRNSITWNSMICGFAQNGRGEEALRIFLKMIKDRATPDYITFVGVLFACSHAGLVDQGRKYFLSMIEEYEIEPGIEHYNCIVDLLGRAGLLEEAENLIENANCRDKSSLWAVLLGACATDTNSAVAAERIAKKAMEMEPQNHLSYVYLANIYRAVGRWEDAVNIRKLMEDRGVKKTPGRSWIETDRKR